MKLPGPHNTGDIFKSMGSKIRVHRQLLHQRHTDHWFAVRDKGKVNVKWICIVPCREHTCKARRYGMHFQVILQFYLHTLRSSANGMNHICLSLPRWSWYSFTDPGGMEGCVGLGWLVCYITGINVRHRELNLDTVAHLSTNRAWRRLTSLIEAYALTTTPDHHLVLITFSYSHHIYYYILQPILIFSSILYRLFQFSICFTVDAIVPFSQMFTP